MTTSTNEVSYRLLKADVRELTPELAEEFRNLKRRPRKGNLIRRGSTTSA
jgi:hypothetical protein